MLPLIVSGICVAGLMLVDKLRGSSEPWNSREESRHFQTDRARWMHEGWMLYEHLQR